MSAQKKERLMDCDAEKDAADSSLYWPNPYVQPDSKSSLRNKARQALDQPEAFRDEFEASRTSLSAHMQTLYRQSVQTSQMCLDVEIKAISAIEERIMAELKLIEINHECIALETGARNKLASRLKEASNAVIKVKSDENAALNALDLMTADFDTDSCRKLRDVAQKRFEAEARAKNMQRIRMEAEQCAIREVEACLEPEQTTPSCEQLTEEDILQMALENGLLATQACTETNLERVKTHEAADEKARRLLDDIRKTNWRNLLMQSPILH